MLFLFIGLTSLIVLFYVYDYIKWKNGPPGPFPFPLVGNLIQMARASPVSNLSIAKFSETYGEIFRLKLGFKDIVILSSYDAITEVFAKEEALGRDVTGSLSDRQQGTKSGLAFSDGAIWEKTRKWTVRNLRNFGFGKTNEMQNGLEDTISEFIQKMESELDSGNDIMDVQAVFSIPTTELSWKMIVGHCTPEDKPLMKRLIHGSDQMFKSSPLGAGIANAFPFIRFLFPKFVSHDVHMQFYTDARNVAHDMLRDAKANEETKNNPNALTDGYAQKLEKDGSDETFNDYNYGTLFLDLLQGSSDTTASYLESILLFMVLHPDVQTKVYEEIKEIVPTGYEVQIEDRPKMIYTQAVLTEVHRHAKIVQNFLPRKALKGFYYKKYYIPKGTGMLADLHSAYNDKSIFSDSFAFKPERFINSNGALVNQKYVIPFSVGKRMCPGEAVSDVTSFLFFTRMIQKFRFSVVPGEAPPREDMQVSFSSRPYPFRTHFSRR